MFWQVLMKLHKDDALRNTELWALAADYKPVGVDKWNLVTKKFKIGQSTFNQLGETWLSNDWRIPA